MALDDWDCHESRMTRAFWDWNRSVEDARGYFDFTYSTCNAAYEVVWERVGREIAGTEYDQYDVFEHYVDILPISSTWMLRSSVIKDMVSAFEAYVENAINEVRRRTDQPELAANVSWNELVSAYEALGAVYQERLGLPNFTPPLVRTADVEYIRNLRHILTHRRGELRTEKDREMFADIAGRGEFARVELSNELVGTVMDKLDATARTLDPLPWHLAGERRTWMSVWKGTRRAVGEPRRVIAAS
jgi:hypothetical protein